MMEPRLLSTAVGDRQLVWEARLYTIKVETTRAPEFLDITDEVREFVKKAGINAGFIVVFSRHTTAAIKLNENEPLLLKDMERFLENISPRDAHYWHNDFTIRTVNMEEDECPNGHAHCQHLIMGTSETIPVMNGELLLGKWQRIFLVELDRPRSREILVQIIGC
jgi:secondary thiamine-phosphate synthase enzyme